MKKILLQIQCLLLAFACFGAAPTPDLAYWRFDESSAATNAFDSSSNGFTGILQGAATIVSNGISGNALRLTRAYPSSSVNMGDVLNLGSSNFSMALWVKFDANDTNAAFIAGRFTQNNPNQAYQMCVLDYGFVEPVPTVTYGSFEYSYGEGSINDGRWHHYVYGRYTNGNVTIHVDGSLVFSNSQHIVYSGEALYPGTNYENTSEFRVGGSMVIKVVEEGTVSTAAFQGYVDELMLFGHALTTSEVQELYNAFTPPGLPIWAYWQFDDAAGTNIVADSGGNGLSGTLSTTGASIVTNGVSGNALSLSRNDNGYVSMGRVLELGTNSFSIAVWIKMEEDDTTDSSIIAGKHYAGTAYLNGYFISANTINGGTTGTAGKALFQQADNTYQIVVASSTTNNVNDGQWHHVVAVYDQGAGSSRIYVDGVATQSGYANVPIFNWDVDFLVGGAELNNANTGYFTGLIDELIVFGVALTDAEVSSLYSSY